MEDIYDAIIIGAGQTGTHCARKLATKGYKVIVLERQQEIGEPNYSTAGTTSDTLERYNIPKELAPYTWHNLYLGGPNCGSSFAMSKYSGCVLDFRKLRQWLAEDAARKGADIAVGVDATDLVIDGDTVVGVKYKGLLSSGKLKAKLVINATGNNTLLARKVDLVPSNNGIIASGLELELVNVKLPIKDALYCWLGDKYVPNGYTWVFPLSPTKVKVGVGRYMFNRESFNLRLCLKSFIENTSWLSQGQPLEFHGGSLYFDSSTKEFARSGFINLCNIANPLGGEGIRHGLQAAEIAATVAAEALESDNFSQDKLSKFNNLWLDYSDNNWKTCQQIAKFVYSDTADTRIDNYLKSTSHLTGDEWFEILFNYQFQDQAKDFLRSALMYKVTHLIG